MTNMNRNNRHIRRNSDRARAITKAKARKTNIIIAVSAVCLAAVIGASAFAFSLINHQSVSAADAASTSVSMKANENKAVQNTKQDSKTATQAPDYEQTAVQAVQNDNSTQAVQSDDQQTAQDSAKSEDRIDVVNGERVYVDTKRTAPEKTGTPATYYAYGKTSYGFDWDYDADNGNFVLNGGYNFDQQQYIFTFYGVTPGVSHVTLYYNTDDNTQASVNLTVTVDNDLNVAVG